MRKGTISCILWIDICNTVLPPLHAAVCFALLSATINAEMCTLKV